MLISFGKDSEVALPNPQLSLFFRKAHLRSGRASSSKVDFNAFWERFLEN
jgi:hypothetical protein